MQNSVKNIQTRMVAVIGLKLEKIEELLNKLTEEKDFLCEIANDNCPGQVILSGLKTSVDKFTEILRLSGARTIIDLQVSAPFHCSLMKPAAEVMSEALEDVSIKKFPNLILNDFYTNKETSLNDILIGSNYYLVNIYVSGLFFY